MLIGAVGFPTDQRAKLEKIFKLSKQTRYNLVDFNPEELPDLLLVFGFELNAHTELATLPQSYHSRIILVGKGRNPQSDYVQLGYPLVSSRVLRTLDALTLENEELNIDSGNAENRFSKYTNDTITADSDDADNHVPNREQFNVLVVDDNDVMQQALNDELQQMPVTVNTDFAGTGEEALEQVAKQQYDFIFLDVVMPGIDGFETCTEMRKRPELKKTPIIMLTSKTSPMDEVKGIMSGCSTYLTKPIEHSEFQKVIARVSNWVDEFKQV